MQNELLAKNLEEKNALINLYFGKIDRTPDTVEAIGELLTCYVSNEANYLSQSNLQDMVSIITELNSFIVRLNDLNEKENHILFYQEDPVTGGLKMNN